MLATQYRPFVTDVSTVTLPAFTEGVDVGALYELARLFNEHGIGGVAGAAQRSSGRRRRAESEDRSTDEHGTTNERGTGEPR